MQKVERGSLGTTEPIEFVRAFALGACLLLPGAAHAWVSTTPAPADPTPVRWDLNDLGTDQEEVVGGRIQFRLDASGTSDVNDGSDLEAIRRAFATWEDVSGAVLGYDEGQPLAAKSINNDGAFAVFWDESGQFPIGGALAVTFTYIYTSGPEVGEIVDTNIVFNGAYTWATDGRANAYDIESVALHEIGHSFGLDHSPVGSATLWPYTGQGETALRTPSLDDTSAVLSKYPSALTLVGTGGIRGFVSQSGGGLLHGAHVTATASDGTVVASTLSLADGSYHLERLDPGDYTLHVEPIGTPRFGIANLGDYYLGSDTSFRSSVVSTPATVLAALDSTVDLLVPSGTATLTPRWVGRSDRSEWRTSMVQATAGEGMVELGAAVEGLPLAGDPLTISGTDLPVISTRFAAVGGFPTALVTVDLHAGVSPGLRTFVIDSGGERVYVTGALEILPGSARADTDGDTIYDDQEGAPNQDTDQDGTPDYQDLDSDGDFILDSEEAGDTDLDTPPVDSDLDGIADFRDFDSDDDGILDLDEAGDQDTNTPAVNSDTDALPDYLDSDSDNDVVLDSWEAGDSNLFTPPVDSDQDQIPDYRDEDSDGDGLADLLEAGDTNPATVPIDSDIDGIPDLLDRDSDDDGVNDGQLHETGDDFDSDGLENFRDPDADNGGESDGSETASGRDPLDPSDDITGTLPGEVPDGSTSDLPFVLWRTGEAGLGMGWSAAADATSYRVYRGTLSVLSTGNWDLTATAGAGVCDTSGALSHVDLQELGDGVSYFYLVGGLNPSGEGSLGASRPAGPGCSP